MFHVEGSLSMWYSIPTPCEAQCASSVPIPNNVGVSMSEILELLFSGVDSEAFRHCWYEYWTPGRISGPSCRSGCQSGVTVLLESLQVPCAGSERSQYGIGEHLWLLTRVWYTYSRWFLCIYSSASHCPSKSWNTGFQRFYANNDPLEMIPITALNIDYSCEVMREDLEDY